MGFVTVVPVPRRVDMRAVMLASRRSAATASPVGEQWGGERCGDQGWGFFNEKIPSGFIGFLNDF